jgi:hypothetical protein
MPKHISLGKKCIKMSGFTKKQNTGRRRSHFQKARRYFTLYKGEGALYVCTYTRENQRSSLLTFMKALLGPPFTMGLKPLGGRAFPKCRLDLATILIPFFFSFFFIQ